MTGAPVTNPYGDLCAEIYDLDKPPGSLFDIAYYTQALKGIEGPILEAAVGTGRLFIPLIEAGLDMVGFDHSPAMLDICRGHLEARGLSARLGQARFQDFEFADRFGAIIVPTSSFILIDQFDEAMAVLGRFRDHLRPGGQLILDLPPPDFLGRNSDGLRVWTAANGDILRMDSRKVELDAVGQRRVNHDVYERWRGGQLVDRQLEVFAFRSWGLKEFEMALVAAGFEIASVGANYRPGRAPRAGDQIFNFVAVRP